MAQKAKSRTKKLASRKPAAKKSVKKKATKKKTLKTKKTTKKKALKKKAVKKKTTKKKAIKKKTIKKKAAKKKAAKKKTTKKTAVRRIKATEKITVPQKAVTPIEPGPPPGSIPPVEEPITHEEAIGTVTHYYSHIGVAIVQINKKTISTGDTIHIKGHTTDFTQQVESMEYEHQHVDQASAGQLVGIKVNDQAREHDIVYLIT